MKYAIEMASGGITCIPSIMLIDLGIKKLLGEGYTYRHTHTHSKEMS
jgi:hypothetical protein